MNEVEQGVIILLSFIAQNTKYYSLREMVIKLSELSDKSLP